MTDVESEVELLDTLPPAARELAAFAAAASRVEPELLRALRLGIPLDADASTEADLWWSPLFEVRGSAAATFSTGVLEPLRRELRGRSARDRAREIIRELHSRAAPLVQLEEEIIWTALVAPGDLAAIDRLLRPVVDTLFGDDARRHTIGAWGAGALPRLPVAARRCPSFWTLLFGIHARTPGRNIAVDIPEDVPIAEIPADVFAGVPDAQLEVEVRDGSLAFRRCRESTPGHDRFACPDVEPLLIQVNGISRVIGRTWAEIPFTGGNPRVCVVDGREYEIRIGPTTARRTDASSGAAVCRIVHPAAERPVAGYFIGPRHVVTTGAGLAGDEVRVQVGDHTYPARRVAFDARRSELGPLLLDLGGDLDVESAELADTLPDGGEWHIREASGRSIPGRGRRRQLFSHDVLAQEMAGAPVFDGARLVAHIEAVTDPRTAELCPVDEVHDLVEAYVESRVHDLEVSPDDRGRALRRFRIEAASLPMRASFLHTLAGASDEMRRCCAIAVLERRFDFSVYEGIHRRLSISALMSPSSEESVALAMATDVLLPQLDHERRFMLELALRGEMKGSRPRVLVVGQSQALSPETVAAAQAVGRALADRGLVMMDGGWPGVDYLAGRAFMERLREWGDPEAESRLTHFTVASQTPDYPEGRTEPVSCVRDSFVIPLELAHAVVIIGGEEGTAAMHGLAREAGIPVLPVGASGGVAAQALRDIQEELSSSGEAGDLGLARVLYPLLADAPPREAAHRIALHLQASRGRVVPDRSGRLRACWLAMHYLEVQSREEADAVAAELLREVQPPYEVRERVPDARPYARVLSYVAARRDGSKLLRDLGEVARRECRLLLSEDGVRRRLAQVRPLWQLLLTLKSFVYGSVRVAELGAAIAQIQATLFYMRWFDMANEHVRLVDELWMQLGEPDPSEPLPVELLVSNPGAEPVVPFGGTPESPPCRTFHIRVLNQGKAVVENARLVIRPLRDGSIADRWFELLWTEAKLGDRRTRALVPGGVEMCNLAVLTFDRDAGMARLGIDISEKWPSKDFAGAIWENAHGGSIVVELCAVGTVEGLPARSRTIRLMLSYAGTCSGDPKRIAEGRVQIEPMMPAWGARPVSAADADPTR